MVTGRVLQRIISKCIMKIARDDAMKAVDNFMLRAGKQAVAESAKDLQLRSEDSTTLGDTIAMAAFALGLSVLSKLQYYRGQTHQ